jgi:uncharacterized protein
VNGRIVWIVDGFTTTSRYPYAQRALIEDTAVSGLDGRFNYIRNSVKAVVDAYEGTVDFYVIDDEDPILQAYQQAFPDLFTTAEPSEELASHFRYPEDLFRLQSNMWGRYHLEDPDDFYNNIGAWVVSRDPGAPNASSPTPTTTAPEDAPPTGPANRMDPYYLLTRLPGEEEESFVMLRPYVPVNEQDARPVLTAFLVASSEWDNYGQLTTYRTPPGEQIDGPQLVAGAIGSDDVVRDQAQRLCQSGSSRCHYGNIVLVPIEQSLLYVQPFYIESSQTNLPLLRQVIVAFGGQVAVGDSLRSALQALPQFTDVPETLDDVEVEDPDNPVGEDPDVRTVAELLSAADALIQEANELPASDLGRYSELIAEARDLIQQAQELLEDETGVPADGSGDPGETTTSTTPTTTTSEPQSA